MRRVVGLAVVLALLGWGQVAHAAPITLEYQVTVTERSTRVSCCSGTFIERLGVWAVGTAPYDASLTLFLTFEDQITSTSARITAYGIPTFSPSIPPLPLSTPLVLPTDPGAIIDGTARTDENNIWNPVAGTNSLRYRAFESDVVRTSDLPSVGVESGTTLRIGLTIPAPLTGGANVPPIPSADYIAAMMANPTFDFVTLFLLGTGLIGVGVRRYRRKA